MKGLTYYALLDKATQLPLRYAGCESCPTSWVTNACNLSKATNTKLVVGLPDRFEQHDWPWPLYLIRGKEF